MFNFILVNKIHFRRKILCTNKKNLNVTYDVLEGLENLDLLTNLSKKLRMSDEPARKLLIKELQAADQETIRQIIYPQILKLIPHSEELIGANPF